MAERLTRAHEGAMPKINNFKRVVEAAPVGPNTINPFKFWWIRMHDFFAKDNIIAKEFPEEGLDQTYELWHGFEDTDRRIQRLVIASQSAALPDLERDAITEVANARQTQVSQFQDNMTLFVAGKFQEWPLADKAMNAAIQFQKDTEPAREDQMTAFAEAVSEISAEKPLDPQFVRQRLAQWLIDEMFTEGAQYAALYLNTEYDDPTSMRDYLEQEKSEIKAALRGKLWDPKTLEAKEKMFKKLLTALYRRFDYSKEDDDVIAFKELWASAKGTEKKLREVSAIQLFDNQDLIFTSLQNNEVFDVELPDEEAELE